MNNERVDVVHVWIFYFLLMFYWFLVLVLGLFVEGAFLYVPVFGILDV